MLFFLLILHLCYHVVLKDYLTKEGAKNSPFPSPRSFCVVTFPARSASSFSAVEKIS